MPKDMHEEFFRAKLLESLKVQMASRNIPHEGKGNELKKVKDHIAEKYGVKIEKMHFGQLNRCSRELGSSCIEYLGGEKRRPAPGAKEPAGFKEFVEAQSG